MSVVRIIIWSLADSKTSLEEIRARLPDAAEGSRWILNEPQERFGVIASGDHDPVGLEELRALIGKDPDVVEEFDLIDG